MDRRISLEQLQVGSTSPIAWRWCTGMTLADALRDHCKLHVHNLSQMTRPEAEALFRTPGERVCVSMFRNA